MSRDLKGWYKECEIIYYCCLVFTVILCETISPRMLSVGERHRVRAGLHGVKHGHKSLGKSDKINKPCYFSVGGKVQPWKIKGRSPIRPLRFQMDGWFVDEVVRILPRKEHHMSTCLSKYELF